MIANPSPAPAPVLPERSIEIRINSLDDAKSAVQHSPHICKTLHEGGYTSIELVIAEELKGDIMPIVAGAFNTKVYYKMVSARPGNALYVLPPFVNIIPRPTSPKVKPQFISGDVSPIGSVSSQPESIPPIRKAVKA